MRPGGAEALRPRHHRGPEHAHVFRIGGHDVPAPAAHVLTLGTPTAEAARTAYNAGDLETALQIYLELAEAPGAHRPELLGKAHATLRALHRKDPNAGHLCRARDIATEQLRRPDFASDQERGAWSEMAAEDNRDLAGVTCPAASSKPTPPPQPEPPPAASGPSPAPGPRDSHPAESGPSSVPGPKDSHPAERGATPEGPAPAPRSDAPQRSVVRTAVGATFAGLTAPLAVGMALSLAGRRNAREELDALNAAYMAENRPPTTGELAAGVGLNDRGRRLGASALGLGLAAGASLVVGLVVLLAPPRADSRARLRASGAGLVYAF